MNDTHRCIDCEALIPQHLNQCDQCWIAEQQGTTRSDASHRST